MKNFGMKVKYFRKEQEMSQEELCQNQSELSVRQLIRIEGGKTAPSLSKMKFIAKRLGIPLASLLENDETELPFRYKELKYLIMRTPTYREEHQVKRINQYFDEIHENFFDILPEDEKVAIEVLQTSMDIHLDSDVSFGGDLVKESFQQVKLKNKYELNDLLMIRLYFFYIYFGNFQDDLFELATVIQLCRKLRNQIRFTHPTHLFLLRDILLQGITILIDLEIFEEASDLIEEANQIIKMTQDYQKKPILDMMEWKLILSQRNDKGAAEIKYNDALLFTKVVGNNYLEEQLIVEWQKDSQN
ncbi:XRE family transcriptional regulator [Streptococcus agalactiae LMG 14747]|uniref:XRE family transcriptional regulator n=1 Tax=Streptococcus agalactiae LMG 14747 TaxID=1154860 RepID=V6Z484_STRAG|nr:XRE family transcriptional regulator [Streptococcus agalactiae LMG 14747]